MTANVRIGWRFDIVLVLVAAGIDMIAIRKIFSSLSGKTPPYWNGRRCKFEPCLRVKLAERKHTASFKHKFDSYFFNLKLKN